MNSPILVRYRRSLNTALRSALLAVLTLWGAHSALANGKAASPAAVSAEATMLVRAQVHTEDFEAVVSVEEGRIWLYLDRFNSNEPVAQARIEAEWRGTPLAVKEHAPGTYELLQPGLAAPGEHALSFSVVAGDSADLLSLSLNVPAPKPAVEPTAAWRPWAGWGTAALLMLSLLAWLVLRRAPRGLAS